MYVERGVFGASGQDISKFELAIGVLNCRLQLYAAF